MSRTIVASAMAIALAITGCASDPTASDEYALLEQKLADAVQQASEIESELVEVTAQRDALPTQVTAAELVIAQVEANEAAHVEAILAKDLDAMMATYSEDAVFVDETFDDWVAGAEALTEFNRIVLAMTDPEATEVLDSYVSADGTRATSVWSWIGTSYYGNPFNRPMVLVHEYANGLIAKQTIYYAAKDAYIQLLNT